MPTWSEILNEVMLSLKSDPFAIDKVRRKYLRELADYVKKPIILYATRWMDYPVINPLDVQITWADKQAFMETVYGIRDKELVLILHSPGGQIEATQAIVEYLRKKFDKITAIVPDAAMSAATLFALASDEIIMGKHSNLGPIDPQFVVTMPYGQVSISAQSLLEEFERAKEEVKLNKDNLLVWAPKIQQYPPGILEEARNAMELTKRLGKEWLTNYMLRGDKDAETKAERVVNFLSDHRELKSHAAPIGRDKLRELGLKIVDLEDDQKLQDLVLSVYHAARIAFQLTAAHKIVENSNGRAFVRVVLPPQAQQQGKQG